MIPAPEHPIDWTLTAAITAIIVLVYLAGVVTGHSL